MQGRASREATDGAVYRGGAILQHAPIFPAIGNHEVQGRRDGHTSLTDSFNNPVPRNVAEAEYEKVSGAVNPSGDPAIKAGWIEDNSFSTRTYEEIFSLPRSDAGGARYYATTVGDVRLVTLFATRIWRSTKADPDPALREDTTRYQEARADLADPLAQGHGAFISEDIGVGSTQFEWLQRITASRAGVDEDAEHYYRFTERIGGVTVLGSDVVLVTDADGGVTGVFNYYRGLGEGFDVTPDASVDEDAEVRLVASTAYLGAGAERSSLETFLATGSFRNELVIYTATESADPTLAWRAMVVVPDTGEMAASGVTYLIVADGASAGEVINAVANAQAASSIATARDWSGESRVITVDTTTILWFRSYEMFDESRDITTYKTSYGLWGLGGPVLPGKVVKRGWFGWDSSAVSAHANAALVYDYYEDVLGRTSFDGRGAPIVVSIRYNPRTSASGYENAFWNTVRDQFAFGDGGYLQAAVDVVAHEYTHAVVTSIVGGGDSVLDQGESGALNEAYADILGVLVEGKTGSGRWLIGEDSGLGAIRDLADPTSIVTSLGAYRDRYSQRYRGSLDDGGEHVNSTIFGHAAYLMMTDPVNRDISDETWAAVFYQSLGRLGTTAKFVDGRAAVLSSACERGLTLAQRTAIANAFDKVEIYGAAPSSTVIV